MIDRLPRILKPVGASPSVSRRRLLKRGGAAVGAVALLGGNQLVAGANTGFTAGAASSTSSTARFAGTDMETLRLDVACDGNTIRINRGPDSEPDAAFVRGDTFIVSGKIFPEGTIDAGLESPDQEGSIGTWVCRGSFFYDLMDIVEHEAAPHDFTNQVFLFDNFDGLTTEGMEGGIRTVRTITGGYGQYAGARGECVEEPTGDNNTMLHLGGGVVIPAFNFKFDFRLMM